MSVIRIFSVWFVIFLMSMWLVSPASAVMVCLQKADGKGGAISCDICIKNVVRGYVSNRIKKDDDDLIVNLAPNYADGSDISDGRKRTGLFASNANQYLFLTGAFNNTPMMVTNGTLLLKNGGNVDFDTTTGGGNCDVKGSETLETPPGTCPPPDKYDPVNDKQISEACFKVSGIKVNDLPITKKFQIITGKGGHMLYGCSQQSISPGSTSSEINIAIYIDGLVTEFRCNVELVLKPLFDYSERLFYLLFLLDFVWGSLAWVSGGGRDLMNFIKNIIIKLMFFGFFMFLMYLSRPDKAFFSSGSWVGQVLSGMVQYGVNFIDPTKGGLLNHVKAGTGATDIAGWVADDTLFLRDQPDAMTPAPAGAPIIGLSPARIMLYGFHLMGAIVSAMIQGILFNMPGIIAGVILGVLTGGMVLTWVIRFLMLFLWVGLTTAVMAMITMVIIGTQMFVAFLELYMVCGLALVFIGFGGSRWTVDNVIKYIGYVIISGLKLLGLMVMMVVAILISHGWVNRLMALAGGGQDFGSALLDFINPLNIVLRMIEALLLYVSLYIQCRVLLTLSVKSSDFIIAIGGGSPVLSGGSVMAVAAAGGALASHATNGMLRMTGHAASIAGNAVGNLSSTFKGIGQGFSAVKNGAVAEQVAPPTGGNDPAPSVGAIAGAATRMGRNDQAGVVSSKVFGSNRNFSDRNIVQKGTSLLAGGVVGSGVVALGAAKVIFSKPSKALSKGAGTALGVGVVAGGLGGAGAGAAVGVGLVLAMGAKHSPKEAKAVGNAIGRGLAKALGANKWNKESTRDNQTSEVLRKKMAGGTEGSGTSGAEGDTTHRSANATPKALSGKVGRAVSIGAQIYMGIGTLGLSHLAIKAADKHKRKKEERGDEAVAARSMKDSPTNALHNLRSGTRSAMTAPFAGAAAGVSGLAGGLWGKVKHGDSFKDGYKETSGKVFASSMTIGKDSMKKRAAVQMKGMAPLAGGMGGKEDYLAQMKGDFGSKFGREISEKKTALGGLENKKALGVDKDTKLNMFELTLSKEAGGHKIMVEERSFAGKTVYRDAATDNHFVLDDKEKKISHLEFKQGDKKAYQTLVEDFNNAKGVKGQIGVVLVGGGMATMDLTSDTLRGLGDLLKGQTSVDGFFGKQAKSASVLVDWTSDPRFADKPQEGFTFVPSLGAPNDGD